MGRVVIADAKESFEDVKFPQVQGVSLTGSIRTIGMIHEPDRPIALWRHEVGPGAEIHWDRPVTGHLIYVWAGDVTIDGTPLDTEGVVVVEHKARAILSAGPKGATLLHFHRQPGQATVQAARAGGNVHVLTGDIPRTENDGPRSKGDLFRQWVDSSCPTCELWLHEQVIPEPRPQVGGRHFHTVDEVVVVKDGGMVVGRHTLGTGSALAVDANTIYTFGVAAQGLTFLNFRDMDSWFVQVSPKNEPLNEPINEREIMSTFTEARR